MVGRIAMAGETREFTLWSTVTKKKFIVVALHHSGAEWKAFCPFHQDTKHSLFINNDKRTFHCFSCADVKGVFYEDYRKPKEKDIKSKKIITVYNYKDEKGILRHQTIRYFPKEFMQRQPKKGIKNPDNKNPRDWDWHLKGVRRVLYRTEKLAQLPKGSTIFIPEGEKDVHTLESWNLNAVTWPMGALNWREEYSEQLRGMNIILIPDNDKPSLDGIYKAANSLVGKAKSIKLVTLPNLKEKGDITGWKEKGHTSKDLQELIDKTPVYKGEEKKEPGSQEKKEKKKEKEERIFITGRQLIEEKIPEPVVPIGKGFLVSERYTILAADDGEGKTTLCTQLTLSAITGIPFLGFFPIPKPVKILYFCGENSRGDIKAKIEFQKTEIEKILNRSIIEDLQDRLILVEPINVNFFLTQGDKKELCNWLEEIKPKIVIFDPLANFISSEKSLSDDRLARGTVSVLTEIAQEYKCFPILTTHFKKDLINPKTGRSMIAVDNAFQMVHGSKYWLNSAASQIVIVRANLQRFAKAKKLGFKFKTVTSTEPIQVLRNPNLWYEELPSDQMDKAKLTPEDVKDVLDRKFKGKALPSQIEDVAGKYLGCSQRQIRDFIKLGKKQGLFWKNKLGQIESVDLVEKNKLFDN